MAQFWKTVSKNTVFMNKAAGLSPPSFWRNAYGNKISDDFLSGGGYRKRDSENGQEWTRYLTTAARFYKYPFNEQILIFAQRPDATACASLELWNEKMNCWVNRGAKGIALLDTENSYTRLKYVFDVSDVHKARRIGRDPNLWELREEHKETVLAQLEKTYGKRIKTAPLNSG